MCAASRFPGTREYPHRIEIVTPPPGVDKSHFRLIHIELALFPSSATVPRAKFVVLRIPLWLAPERLYFDQTATLMAMVVAIFATDHLLSPTGVTVKQFGLERVQVVQKPFVLSFHVPVSLVPESSTGSRVILPSGVKVILNLVPDGDVVVNGSPVKKVA